jgi:hypothetical protein
MDAMQYVPTMGSDRDGLDTVLREGLPENIFQLKLHDFPTGLRRPLFGPFLEVVDLAAQVLDEPVSVGFLQTMLLVRFLLRHLADGRALAVQSSSYGEFQLLLPLLQLAPVLRLDRRV